MFGTVSQILSVSSNQLLESDDEQGGSAVSTDNMKSEVASLLTHTADEVPRNTSVKSVVELSSSPVSKVKNVKVLLFSSYFIKSKNLLMSKNLLVVWSSKG